MRSRLKAGDIVRGETADGERVTGTLQQIPLSDIELYLVNIDGSSLAQCVKVQKIYGKTFSFGADIPDFDQMVADIEEQVLAEVQKCFGTNKSGDDIKDYHCKLTVNVVMK